jgi:hypothetical protein
MSWLRRGVWMDLFFSLILIGLVKTNKFSIHYFLNTTEVKQPEGADDGEPILSPHDVEMLSYF